MKDGLAAEDIMPKPGQPGTDTAAELTDEASEEAVFDDTPKKTPETFVSLRVPRAVLWTSAALVVLAAVLGVSWKMGWVAAAMQKYNQADVVIKAKEGDKFPLEGAVVALGEHTYTTDSNGRVAVEHIPAGTYDLKLSKDGYENVDKKLVLKRGANDLQVISLTKLPDKVYAVKGYVQDYVSGKPIQDVQVTLGSKTENTDPAGQYDFEKIAPGDIKLVLSKAGYVTKEVSDKLVDTDLVSPKLALVPDGQVIFVSNRDGQRNLYVSGYDGSSQRLFVQPANGGEDYNPAIAPDTKQVAFSSTRDKVKDANGNDLVKLYVTGPDGKTVKKVSDDMAFSIFPTWSPDSKRLYYEAYSDAKMTQRVDRVYDLQKGTLTTIGESAAQAVFSPNGLIIAYLATATDDVSGQDGQPGGAQTVYVVKTLNLATGERRTVIKRQEYLSDIRFGTDSRSVSYEAYVAGVRRRFEMILVDGSKETEIATLPVAKRVLYPSADGSLSAFVEQRDGKTDLFTVDKDGKNEKRLTILGTVSNQVPPRWDEGGKYLTFAVKREAENALYVVSLDGGDPKKVADYYYGPGEGPGYGYGY